MLTRTQKYAVQVFQQVSQVAQADRKKYGSMAHKLPVLVRTAGLAQALEFASSRKFEPQRRICTHLAEAVGVPDLLVRSRQAELPEYMRLTREVLSALEWYRRFAESVLDVKRGEDEGGDDDEHQT